MAHPVKLRAARCDVDDASWRVKLTNTLACLTETDDKIRALAEKVFASETKDENVRDEISMFDVAEDCPILHHEMAHHLHTDDDAEKR